MASDRPNPDDMPITPDESFLTKEQQERLVRDAILQSSVHLANIAAAQLHMAGIAVAEVRANGSISLRGPTPEETAMRQMAGTAPAPPVAPGKMVPLMGDGGPISWVFTPPPPYNTAVEIVCSPDETDPIAMRCMAIRKFPGARRVKYQAKWEEVPEL